jgi:enamine deaminase RidA (YjgF/YER057c/UK114 family)
MNTTTTTYTDRSSITIDSQRWYDAQPGCSAVRVGDLVFVSGQLSVDNNGKIRDRGDVTAQARNCLESLRDVLTEAGGTLDDVVEVQSFHTDLRQMDPVFDVAREFFTSDYPAWTAVGSTGLPNPEALVSIRAIAHVGEGQKETFTPDTLKWYRDLPVSAACKKGNLVFVGGIIPTDADGNVINPGDHEGQARFCWNRVKEIAEWAGGSADDVIEITTFHQDARGQGGSVDAWYNDYGQHLSTDPDETVAITAIAVPGLYKFGALASWRAIIDLTPGKRIGATPASLWWKVVNISGASMKEGSTFVGLAGEVASDGDGNITTPGDTAAQARYAFARLAESLEMLGGKPENIVEVTAYHKDPRAWEIVQRVGAEFFGDHKPAWTPVGVTGLFKDGYVHEIHALAVL